MLADAFEGIVAAHVRLYPEGWRDPVIHDVQYLANKLLRVDPDLAIAAAQGAYDGDRRNLYFATTLAAIMREADSGRDGARRGAALLLRTFEDLGHANPETIPNLRQMFTEWGTCVGYAGDAPADAAANYCLAILSVADGVGGRPIKNADPSWALRSVGRALLDLRLRWKKSAAERALRATLTLLRLFGQRPGPTGKFVKRFEDAAGGRSLPNIADAVEILERTYEEAWELLPDDLGRALNTYSPPLMLDELRRLAHELDQARKASP